MKPKTKKTLVKRSELSLVVKNLVQLMWKVKENVRKKYPMKHQTSVL